MHEVTFTNAEQMRAIAKDPRFTSAELYKAESNGHKFKVGDICTLTGLQDSPEYNGDQVEITAIRKDGSHGKAYYYKGRMNEISNWVYEYRLK